MLAGLKVVQFANLFPGPLAGLMLHSLGATVTTVEPPGGDPIKKAAGPVGTDLYNALNQGKHETIELDVRQSEADQRRFLDLVQGSDALIHSMRPGAFSKAKLEPLDLRARCPDVVIASLTGYGISTRSPLASRAGHDLTYLARSGLLTSLSPPAPPVVQIADVAGGTYPSVIGILAGSLYKERTLRAKEGGSGSSYVGLDGEPGLGCCVDVAMCDASRSLGLLKETAREALRGTQVPDVDATFPLGGAFPCYRCYKTAKKNPSDAQEKQRYVAVASLEFPYWKRFVTQVLGFDPAHEIATAESQMALGKKGKDVVAAVEEKLSEKTLEEWMPLLSSVDCMVDPVLTAEEAARSEHFMRRWGDYKGPGEWTGRAVNAPFQLASIRKD